MTTTETRTIQVWPGGQSFTYQGDPDGPADQKRLKKGYDRTARWRRGTAAEWRSIRIELRAELYGNRDIQGCDSSLVDDLLKASSSGEVSGDLGSGFSYDEIRGLYPDVDSWNIDQCKAFLDDQGAEDEQPEPDEIEDEDAWRRLVRAHDLEPAEVYEWWRVSSWLCDQLAEIGEVTIDNGYGRWWGRTCTGQQWIMDGTLQKIAAKFEDAGIMPFRTVARRRSAWSPILWRSDHDQTPTTRTETIVGWIILTGLVAIILGGFLL